MSFKRSRVLVGVGLAIVIGTTASAEWRWGAIGGGANDGVRAVAVYKGELIAAGDFTTIGGSSANRIARWDGSAWWPLGTDQCNGVAGGCVHTLAVWTDPNENELLIVGGAFTQAGCISANYIAAWDGESWSALGSGVGPSLGWVIDLCVYEELLIAGGAFTTAGGYPANHIAQWDGENWKALGDGVGDWVEALAVYNGKLIAGGNFFTAGGQPANGIASWSGSTGWQPLGSGVGGWWPYVYGLAEYGGVLVVGGTFSTAGGNAANQIATWDGSAWAELDGGTNHWVYEVYAADSPNLVIGGQFTGVGDITANRIAGWTDAGWSAYGSGMSGPIYAIGEYNGNLIAGGFFTTAGGVTVNNIARWYSAE